MNKRKKELTCVCASCKRGESTRKRKDPFAPRKRSFNLFARKTNESTLDAIVWPVVVMGRLLKDLFRDEGRKPGTWG